MHLLRRNGFTLIEIMIVVAIIAIALAIAIPNYRQMTTTAKRTLCIDNLKNIAAAVERWAADNSIPAGVVITDEQAKDFYANYFRSGKPTCPSGGQYTLNPVGTTPQVQCTKESEGHKI